MKLKTFLLAFLLLVSLLHPSDFNGYDFIPYQGMYKTIETKRFSVLYPQKFQQNAIKTATYAEEIYTKMESFFNWKPFGKIIIILSDHTDQPNGLSYTFPRNTIQLYITSTDGLENLREFDDPLYSLLVHEMTHTFQIDQIRGAAFFWRVMHGRLYFPATGTFSWFREGTAVYTESALIEKGRLDGNYNRELIRKSAEQRAIPDYERLVSPVSQWPYGDSVYQFGAAFTQYLIDTYGKEKFDKFNNDLSNDFWPFIYEFVLKFKKIYGKNLNKLWDEWRKTEYDKYPEQQKPDSYFLKSDGEIAHFGIYQNTLYYSLYDMEKGSGIYRKNDSGKDYKLCSDYPERFTFTKEGILYTKYSITPSDCTYSDLYLIDYQGKNRKRLTYNKRIKNTAFNTENNIGIYIKENKFTIFSIENKKIISKNEITPEGFEYVDDIDISPSGTFSIFSGRMRSGENFVIGLINMKSSEIAILQNITGRKTRFVTNSVISFISKLPSIEDQVFTYNMETTALNILPDTSKYIKSALVTEDSIYRQTITNTGEAIYKERRETENSYTESIFAIKSLKMIPETDYKVGYYNPMKYIYPTVWALIPYQLNSTFTIPFIGINTKNIAPAFMIYNRSPLGRFIYQITTAFDYKTFYPETDIQLAFKLPLMDINYNFYTYRYYFANSAYFPAVFYNYLSLNPYITIDSNNLFSIFTSGSVSLFQNRSEKAGFSYMSSFAGKFIYKYSQKKPASDVWNAGLQVSTTAVAQFYKTKIYGLILTSEIENRIPIDKHYFYMKTSGGYNLIGSNIFSVGTNMFLLNQSILGNSGSSITTVDFKGFSFNLGNYYTGKGYVYGSTGFHFILYRTTHYWHFLSGGFSGLYLQPFTEFAAVFNNNQDYLVDSGVELIVDLFAAYGNIDIELKQGNAAGYQIGKPYPVYNGYFYISIGL